MNLNFKAVYRHMNISDSFLIKAILMELSITERLNLRLTKQFTERIGLVHIPT